jgi:hypothetical protein
MKSVTRIFGVVMGLALVIGLAPSASAQDVKTDYDHAIDFSKYKTFAIQVKTTWGTPFAEKRALDEVTKALVAKGWAPATDPAKADASVMIHGATQTKHDVNTYYSGGGWRFGGGMANTSVTEFQVGSMLVDIFDAKTKSLIWRGMGSDELSDKADKNQKKLVNATEKMFKNFPPTPGKS